MRGARLGYDARVLASPQLTGIGRYTLRLLDAVAARGEGWRRTLFFPRGGPASQPPPGFVVRNAPVRGDMREDRFYRLWFDAWLPVEIAVRRISLFHGTSYLLPRAHRARRVVTVYDLAHEKRPEWAGGCSPEFARRARESARRADAVIATSRCTRRDIVEIYGVPEERVAVVYGGVDPAFRPLDDRAAAEAFRRRKGLPERFVLSVLSLSPRKNIPGLLRAFAIFARSSGLPQHLVIAGKSYGADGPLREAAGLGIAGRFRFIDYVRDEELVLLYNAADLFVFPSFYEGFGLPPSRRSHADAPSPPRAPVPSPRSSGTPRATSIRRTTPRWRTRSNAPSGPGRGARRGAGGSRGRRGLRGRGPPRRRWISTSASSDAAAGAPARRRPGDREGGV